MKKYIWNLFCKIVTNAICLTLPFFICYGLFLCGMYFFLDDDAVARLQSILLKSYIYVAFGFGTFLAFILPSDVSSFVNEKQKRT